MDSQLKSLFACLFDYYLRQERTFDSTGFPAEGILIFAPAVPHCVRPLIIWSHIQHAVACMCTPLPPPPPNTHTDAWAHACEHTRIRRTVLKLCLIHCKFSTGILHLKVKGIWKVEDLWVHSKGDTLNILQLLFFFCSFMMTLKCRHKQTIKLGS